MLHRSGASASASTIWGSGDTVCTSDDGIVFLTVVLRESGQGVEDAFVLDGEELGGPF